MLEKKNYKIVAYFARSGNWVIFFNVKYHKKLNHYTFKKSININVIPNASHAFDYNSLIQESAFEINELDIFKYL